MDMSELKQRLYKYELARLGFKETKYLADAGKFKIQADNDRMPLISNGGDISYGTEYSHLVINIIGPLVYKINEIVAAWENSRQTPFDELSQYKIFAEYNNVVLAARDDAEYGKGLYFATWEYDDDHMGFHQGFYTESYAAAKESFALRSGLVKKEKVINWEQAADIKAAIDFYRINSVDYDLEKRLAKIEAALHYIYPTLPEVSVSQQLNIENTINPKTAAKKPSLQEKLNSAKEAARQSGTEKSSRGTKTKNHSERG